MSSATRALLSGLIDYAGLFPPAARSMADAVANYAAYRDGADHWALGRFVVPISRLAEFEAAAAPHLHGAPWRLAVLAQASDHDEMLRFNARQAGRAVIDAVETKASTVVEIETMESLAIIGDVFVEIPVTGDPDGLLLAIYALRLRAKIRTGGVTADAAPAPADVVRFLSACVLHGVPFKATAGLHHPLRGEYPLTYAPDAPRGTMHGYLNVFLAALFLRHGMSESDTVALLEERDASAFSLADGVRWRAHTLTVAQVADARARFAGSFGSCSFREPLDDLSALALP